MFKNLIIKKIIKYFKQTISIIVQEELMNKIRVFGDSSLLTISTKAIVNNTLFNTNSGKIIIKDYVGIAHNTQIITGSHNFSKINSEREKAILQNRDITIEEGAFIGSGCIILGPCKIGANTVIGAGSVVINDIPANVIAVGNPCKIIKTLEIN